MSIEQELEILRKARELLSDESRWTKGVSARDEALREAYPRSALAVCWCATGAVLKASGPPSSRMDSHPVLRLEQTLHAAYGPGRYVQGFNDDESTTHADVLALFDLTIERLTEWYSVEKLLTWTSNNELKNSRPGHS